MRAVILAEARADVRETVAWYEAQQPGPGRQFAEEIAVVARRLREWPQAGMPCGEGILRAMTKRFPYALYYTCTTEAILVAGVLHQRRDPQLWRERFHLV